VLQAVLPICLLLQSNRRNGTSSKALKGQDGELPLAIPSDRERSFEPELIKKGQTRIVHLVLHSLNCAIRRIRSAFPITSGHALRSSGHRATSPPSVVC